MGKSKIALLICGAGLLASFAAVSARLLVVNHPADSDVIVVLAGETDKRPDLGLSLLAKGVAPVLILDVPGNAKIYKISETEIAKKYIRGLNLANVDICPIYGTSTFAEAREVGTCLQTKGGSRVLIVTSDYHSRRALAIFRRECPRYNLSVAACEDPAVFGVHWWKSREWAKTNFNEWVRLIWWELVDRWR